jgi:hypothetical protein
MIWKKKKKKEQENEVQVATYLCDESNSHTRPPLLRAIATQRITSYELSIRYFIIRIWDQEKKNSNKNLIWSSYSLFYLIIEDGDIDLFNLLFLLFCTWHLCFLIPKEKKRKTHVYFTKQCNLIWCSTIAFFKVLLLITPRKKFIRTLPKEGPIKRQPKRRCNNESKKCRPKGRPSSFSDDISPHTCQIYLFSVILFWGEISAS